MCATGAISKILSNWNRAWIHSHLVCKWKLKNLTKLAVWVDGWVVVYELRGDYGCDSQSSYNNLIHLQLYYGDIGC